MMDSLMLFHLELFQLIQGNKYQFEYSTYE